MPRETTPSEYVEPQSGDVHTRKDGLKTVAFATLLLETSCGEVKTQR
jgi:hypothetical protein